MSVEDRLRAAARARTDVVTSVRPLELPAESSARVRTGHTSRWFSWGAPVAAAALVTALALTLVLIRQAADPRPAPSAPASGAASIPRYYVQLAYTGSTSAQMRAIVGDDRTGRKVAVLNPSASENFYGVTGAADDRTFVLMNYQPVKQQTTWYLLRIAPGTAHPARLFKLPIKPLAAHVAGLALSPDGRELAVMWRTATTQTNAVSYLAVYSLSSGAALATWNVHGDNDNLIGGPNKTGLSWVNGDRSLEFRWAVPPKFSTSGKVITPAMITVRRLDLTAAGSGLLTDSRVIVRLPTDVERPKIRSFSVPCATSLAAGDGTVVCGMAGSSYISGVPATLGTAFVSHSGTTGKQLNVLYRYPDPVLSSQFEVLWTDQSGSRAIGLLLLALKGEKASQSDLFGVVGGGHFIKLPALVGGGGTAGDSGAGGAADDQGGIAF